MYTKPVPDSSASRSCVTAELPWLTIEELVFMRELHLRDPEASAETHPLDWPAWTDAYRFEPTDRDTEWWAAQTLGPDDQPPSDPPPHAWIPSRWQGGDK